MASMLARPGALGIGRSLSRQLGFSGMDRAALLVLTAMTKHLHALLATLIAAGSLAATGAAPAVASTHRHHHRSHHGIPQHNRGDRDGDNNGGRDDRDGHL